MLYLRSSKDRSDVSIDAQRRALQEVAQARGLVVVAEQADAVESGKDDDRPGFQALLRSLKDSARGWENILVLDTSRVARRRHLALIFEHEAKRAGVRIFFKNVPDTDPITEMLLKSILQAMDEWHSLTSRAKGLAGMAENVRQGWRAGGRAPRGYKLEYHSTGAIREGVAVLKSKLTPNEDAPMVGAYLKARASGKPRGRVISDLGMTWQASSLNDLEWMALTYAGHTAWNTTNERTADGYVGEGKRRPRAEWVVQRDTHPALITDAEAEYLLTQLEKGRWVRTRATDRPYLLTGLLVAPDGSPWSGEWDSKMNAGLYRLGKGRRISARRIDTAVLEQLQSDLMSDEAVTHILRAMRGLVDEPVDGRKIAAAEKKAENLTNKVARLVDLITEAGEHERAAYRRTIEAHENERAQLLKDLEEMRERAGQHQAAKRYTEADARRLLRLLFDELQSARDSEDVERKKAALSGLIQKVEFEANSDFCQVFYRIGADLPSDTGFNLATLRGSYANPVEWVAKTTIIDRKKRPSG